MTRDQQQVRQIALMTLALATAPLAVAWIFEIFGGYKPCPLCLQQRWAYYFSLPVLVLIVLRLGRPGTDIDVVRWGFLAVVLAFLLNAGLGFYHSGVEWGWFEGPSACASGAGLSGGLPDLTRARVISCTDAQWRMFGLSFAGWNVVASLVLAAMAAIGIKRTYAYGSSSVSQ